MRGLLFVAPMSEVPNLKSKVRDLPNKLAWGGRAGGLFHARQARHDRGSESATWNVVNVHLPPGARQLFICGFPSRSRS